MTSDTETTSLHAETLVEAPVDQVFTLFTEGIGTWWNPDHHIIDAPLAGMVFEPRVGGHVYDVGTDGSECRWGRVLAYEPPHRVVFSWDINTRWQLESDPARTSEVEVTFTPEGPGATRVHLEHRHLERHGEGWVGVRGGLGSGWTSGLERFATVAVRR